MVFDKNQQSIQNFEKISSNFRLRRGQNGNKSVDDNDIDLLRVMVKRLGLFFHSRFKEISQKDLSLMKKSLVIRKQKVIEKMKRIGETFRLIQHFLEVNLVLVFESHVVTTNKAERFTKKLYKFRIYEQFECFVVLFDEEIICTSRFVRLFFSLDSLHEHTQHVSRFFSALEEIGEMDWCLEVMQQFQKIFTLFGKIIERFFFRRNPS